MKTFLGGASNMGNLLKRLYGPLLANGGPASCMGRLPSTGHKGPVYRYATTNLIPQRSIIDIDPTLQLQKRTALKNTLILALDLGTSSVRAMLFDIRGKDLPGMEAQIPYTQRTSADGGVDVDAEELLALTVRCVGQLLRKTDKP